MEVWERITAQNKSMQLFHYANIVNKMRIVHCNMLANRKKNPKKPLVKDLVRFCNVPCSRSAHIAICCFYELGSGQGKPCCGLLCRSCILPTVVVPGWVLPEALYPLRGKMGLINRDHKDFAGGCKVLVELHLTLLKIRAHSMVGVRKRMNSQSYYQHLAIWRLRIHSGERNLQVRQVWTPRALFQLCGACSSSPSSADKEASNIICAKAGANDLLIPLWNGSRCTHQCLALLLQQGKLFILLEVGYLNSQKQFSPVSFNLSAAAVLVIEQDLCVLLTAAYGQGWGSRREGCGKVRADPFPSTIPITPNCPALSTNSQMPCAVLSKSHPGLVCSTLPALFERTCRTWGASRLSSSVTTGKNRAEESSFFCASCCLFSRWDISHC